MDAIPKTEKAKSVNDVTLCKNYITHYQSKGCNLALSNNGCKTKTVLLKIKLFIIPLKKKRDEP